MKPVLHFQIPATYGINVFGVKNLQTILESLKTRFSDDYDVIITPFQLQAENVTNIILSHDCDMERIIQQLRNIDKKNAYDYHSKYLPSNVYFALDYDGDENIHPLDAMIGNGLIDPFMITNIKDRYNMIDIHDVTETGVNDDDTISYKYLRAANLRRLNKINGSEVIPNDTF